MSGVRHLLATAEESLNAAELLRQNDYIGFAASRAYYGCFYVAEALLLSLGLEFSSHGQVVAQYGYHFSRTGLLDPVYHRLLAAAFDLRQLGDYETDREIETAVVEKLLEDSRAFLAAATRYLDENPTSEESPESAGRDDG